MASGDLELEGRELSCSLFALCQGFYPEFDLRPTVRSAAEPGKPGQVRGACASVIGSTS